MPPRGGGGRRGGGGGGGHRHHHHHGRGGMPGPWWWGPAQSDTTVIVSDCVRDPRDPRFCLPTPPGVVPFSGVGDLVSGPSFWTGITVGLVAGFLISDYMEKKR